MTIKRTKNSVTDKIFWQPVYILTRGYRIKKGYFKYRKIQGYKIPDDFDHYLYTSNKTKIPYNKYRKFNVSKSNLLKEFIQSLEVQITSLDNESKRYQNLSRYTKGLITKVKKLK